MSGFRPTDELRSVGNTIRAIVKPGTPEIPIRKAVTEALAEVNDLRFIYSKECLSEEEMERIRKQIEERQNCAGQDT